MTLADRLMRWPYAREDSEKIAMGQAEFPGHSYFIAFRWQYTEVRIDKNRFGARI